MPRKKDLTGQKFGQLTVLQSHGANKDGRGIWLCQCSCGKMTVVSTNKLTGGQTKSCGCAIKGVNRIDITGQRFGRLVALHPTEKRLGNSVIWHCQCDCGKTADVASIDLRRGDTKSCGCLSSEIHSKSIKSARQERASYLVDGTDVLMLMRKPGVRNTSGTVGVSFDKSVGLWKAYIQFKRRTYRLGASADKNKAIALRKEAEQRLHGNFLEWYYATHPNKKPKNYQDPPLPG